MAKQTAFSKQHSFQDNKEAQITERACADFLNTELKATAQYIIETRALPSIMDGMRVGARKITYAALTGDLKKHEEVKMQALTGDTLKLEYNHGDSSLYGTVVQLSSPQTFSIAPLEVDGQIGTLRVPDVDVAARYLKVSHSKYMPIFKMDWNLLELKTEEGMLVEPKYFLPIIPVALLWRTNSPGFGFSFRGFTFDLADVIDATLEAVRSGSCTGLSLSSGSGITSQAIEIKPAIAGIKPENIIFNQSKNIYYNVGEYTLSLEADTMFIKDLPFNMSYQKFEENLQDLLEKGYITDFVNRSRKGAINYIVKFATGRLKLLSNEKWKFFQTMKMFTKIPKLTLNCLDTNGKTILNYETPNDLVDAFVRRRLFYYEKRKTITIANLRERIAELNNRRRFIQLVIDDKLIINKRPIADIKKDLTTYGLPFDVLDLKISRLTVDEIKKLDDEIIENQQELDYILKTGIHELYINDLIEMRRKYIGVANATPSTPSKTPIETI